MVETQLKLIIGLTIIPSIPIINLRQFAFWSHSAWACFIFLSPTMYDLLFGKANGETGIP